MLNKMNWHINVNAAHSMQPVEIEAADATKNEITKLTAAATNKTTDDASKTKTA